MKTIRVQGLVFAFLTAVLAAVYDVLTRFYSTDVTPWQIVLARGLFGLAISMMAARTMGLSLLGKNRAGMFLAALTLVSGMLSLIFALFVLPVFEAVLLLYLYPVFGALFSPLLVNERMGLKVWGLIGMAFFGTAFVLWPQEQVWSLNWGHLLGIVAGLGHGLALTLVRRYSPGNSTITQFFYVCLVGTIVSVSAMSFGAQAVEVTRASLAGLAAIAATAGLAQLCMLRSAACITSAEVGIIGMSEIVFASLLGFVFFHEAVGLRQLFGGILVIASGVILALDSGRDAPLPGKDDPLPSGVKPGSIHT